MKKNAIKGIEYEQGIEILALRDAPSVLMQYFENRCKERTGEYCHYMCVYESRFRKNACQLADVEDDFPIIVEPQKQGGVVYQGMSLPELRSYFTLRTGFRKGIFPDAPGEYISLYVTETMMLIGVKDVEEAWSILQKIWQTYCKRMLPDFSLSQLDQNIRDFIIFNDLSNHLLPAFEGELQVDAIPIRLRHIQELSDDAIWELLPSLSMYSFANTIKLLGDADFVKRTVAKVLRNLDVYYRDHRQGSLAEQRICTRTHLRCFSLFYAIVFPPEDDRKDKVIFVFDEVRRYIREKGNCYVEYYACPEVNTKKSCIYNLLHEIDRQIRIICKRRDSLSAFYMPDPEMEVVANSIARESQTTAAVKRQEAIAREAQQRQALIEQRLKIDPGKLSVIRSDAAATCEKLLSDEERGLTEVVAAPSAAGKEEASSQLLDKLVSTKADIASAASLSPHSNVPVSQQDSPSQPANAPTAIQLSPDEQQFLYLLLSSSDWRAFLRRKHLMLSVVMEAVNNKCFDAFGDVVLQDSDGQPAIIEDYREELASLLPSPPPQSSRPRTQSKRGE